MIFRFEFDSCHPKLGRPLKNTLTVTVVLSQGLSSAGMKSAQVQQILNQKQHSSLCQAAVQSAWSVQASLSLWHQAAEPDQNSSINLGVLHNSEGQAHAWLGKYSNKCKQTGAGIKLDKSSRKQLVAVHHTDQQA